MTTEPSPLDEATAEPTTHDGADWRQVAAEQSERIDEQADVIERLLDRLDRLEHERSAPRADRSRPDAGPTTDLTLAPSGLGASTSRRSLLTKGAATAATAVVGTAAVGLATASPAAAASGNFDGDTAVYAISTSTIGYGVLGVNSATSGRATGVRGASISPSGAGVRGSNEADSGEAIGVQGVSTYSVGGRGVTGIAQATSGNTYGVVGTADSPAGTGLYGGASSGSGATTGVRGETVSPAGTAVRALAIAGTGVETTSNRTQVLFAGAPAAPPAAGLARVKGELVFDANADLWLCVAAGTPGTWRKVAGPATAGAFTILPSTIRIYDSRAGNIPLNVTKGQLGNQQIRTLDAKIGGAVPAGATAALVNITIVNTGDPGYLALYKNGIPYPGNSTINWNQPATLLANSAVVALDDQARFAVKANIGFCDFVIDTIGYYR